MNRKRIKKMIDVLERVPEQQFNMSVWIKNDYTTDNKKRSVSKAIKKGMVGCVVGWAAQSKYLINEGLRRDPTGGFYYLKPTGIRSYGVIGFADFLGISSSEARDFIYDHNYSNGKIKPKHAIKKLKRLLKDGDRYE